MKNDQTIMVAIAFLLIGAGLYIVLTRAAGIS